MFEKRMMYRQKSRAAIGRCLLFANIEAEWNNIVMMKLIELCEVNQFL